jgi:hypothetical protein
MFRRKNQLLSTALAFAGRGIPVTPSWPSVAAPDASRSWPRKRMCGCGDHECPTPGAHPSSPRRLTDPDAVRRVWDVPNPPNLLISSGRTLGIWHVPRAVGAYGMRILEQRRPGAWPPVMRGPSGDWIFCTTAPTHEQQAAAAALQVSLLGPGTPVLAPPSRRPNGAVRWLWSQRFPATSLPAASVILSAFETAVTDRMAVRAADDRGVLDGRAATAL